MNSETARDYHYFAMTCCFAAVLGKHGGRFVCRGRRKEAEKCFSVGFLFLFFFSNWVRAHGTPRWREGGGGIEDSSAPSTHSYSQDGTRNQVMRTRLSI